MIPPKIPHFVFSKKIDEHEKVISFQHLGNFISGAEVVISELLHQSNTCPNLNYFNEETNLWLSWDEFVDYNNINNLKTPDIIFRGKFVTMADVFKWMEREVLKQSRTDLTRIGFVIRATLSFNNEEFRKNNAQYIGKII